MPRTVARQRANTAALPEWVVPQLTQLVETAPDGDQWLHEIKTTATGCMRGWTAAR
jgi:hypothetical protein